MHLRIITLCVNCGENKGKNKMKVYQRLKYGSSKYMSKEEYQEHKRVLQHRWRHNNPEKIKRQNKKYADIYKETKPFECVCSKCGKTFNASRSSFKTCPNCVKESHRLVMMRKKAAELKTEERKAEYTEIIKLYKQGHTQQVLAETFGRSQSGISVIIRRLNKKGKK